MKQQNSIQLNIGDYLEIDYWLLNILFKRNSIVL